MHEELTEQDIAHLAKIFDWLVRADLENKAVESSSIQAEAENTSEANTSE